jgi:hypothetical protein
MALILLVEGGFAIMPDMIRTFLDLIIELIAGV